MSVKPKAIYFILFIIKNNLPEIWILHEPTPSFKLKQEQNERSEPNELSGLVQ